MSETTKGTISPKAAAERSRPACARRSRERFRVYGRIAIGVALAFLVTLFVSIFSRAFQVFQHYVTLEVTLGCAARPDRRSVGPVIMTEMRAALFVPPFINRRVWPVRTKAAGKLISAGAGGGFATRYWTTRPFWTPPSG